MSFVKDNGGPLAIAGTFLVIVGAYIELRLPSDADIDVKIAERFVEAGNVPPHRMDRAEEKIEHLEGEDDRIEQKLETVARILMED